MNAGTQPNYELQSSYFSFWQVMAFILVFAFVGSWVLRTFAGEPDIKKFTVLSQASGRVDLVAQTKKQPADDLVVTNICHPLSSPISSTQTAGFSDWTLNMETGYTGQISLGVPSQQKCTAYVHSAKDTRILAQRSYTTL